MSLIRLDLDLSYCFGLLSLLLGVQIYEAFLESSLTCVEIKFMCPLTQELYFQEFSTTDTLTQLCVKGESIRDENSLLVLIEVQKNYTL